MSGPVARLASALSRAWWLRACDAVGPGAVLDGRPWIESRGRLVVGARLRLASSPVQSHLVVPRGGALEIGDDVSIGYGAAIAAHALVSIASGARIGPFAAISDTDFHVAGDRAARPETTPVTIGPGAHIGARVTILRGARIGAGARVTAGSVVAGEVPAGARVAGVPARPVSARAGPLDGDPAAQVAAILADALGLAAAPAGPDRLDAFPQWDSLGTLTALVALEDALGVRLDAGALERVRTVAELGELVLAGGAHAA